jgi:hypothetical protein
MKKKNLTALFALASLAAASAPALAGTIACADTRGTAGAILTYDGPQRDFGYGILRLTFPYAPGNISGHDFKGEKDPEHSKIRYGFIELADPHAAPRYQMLPFYIAEAKTLQVDISGPDNRLLNRVTCQIPRF